MFNSITTQLDSLITYIYIYIFAYFFGYLIIYPFLLIDDLLFTAFKFVFLRAFRATSLRSIFRELMGNSVFIDRI